MSSDIITMVHGSGGSATSELIESIFEKNFDNDTLSEMEDSAVVEGAPRFAVTTDSFVVKPLFFQGGDIGRLSICGTVNDLLMRGAVPKYITCGMILEEGASIDNLRRITESMAETAKEAGVEIVAGDTKVIEGNGGIIINTAGVGFVDEKLDIASGNARPGDKIIVSGNIGEHHAAILASRLGIETDIKSDCAPLVKIVHNLIAHRIRIHVLRDVTRGGLATVLKEIAGACGNNFMIKEELLPVTSMVKEFCGLLGLDPLYMGNEGKLVAIVHPEDEEAALDIIRHSTYGQDAVCIGEVVSGGDSASGNDRTSGNDCTSSKDHTSGSVILETLIGGRRELDVLQGEGLPRIC